jgi:multiple sugar transport system ATP-binding protein
VRCSALGSSGANSPVKGSFMATVSFQGATREYPGSARPAVNELDLEIGDGEFLVLVGPSGCGKSTSLRMLAGLEPVDGGAIRVGDRDVTSVSPSKRDIAMVFQNYALYPHMTVAENMGFALKIARVPKAEIERRVREAAVMLDLTDYLTRKPKALSGGQRQRVAMGRAIVRSPQVFCMDEPLSNLDAKLRVATRTQIASLQRRLGVTTVYVTHDQVEAMTMGDRVAVLRDGVLQQVGAPAEIYHRPANVFVAGFMGSPAMNLLTVPVDARDGLQLGEWSMPLPRDVHDALGSDTVVLGARPEDLRLCSDGTGISATVEIVEELGADAYVHATIDGRGHTESLVVRVNPQGPPAKGERISVAPDPEKLHYFEPAEGRRLQAVAA